MMRVVVGQVPVGHERRGPHSHVRHQAHAVAVDPAVVRFMMVKPEEGEELRDMRKGIREGV